LQGHKPLHSSQGFVNATATTLRFNGGLAEQSPPEVLKVGFHGLTLQYWKIS
jgi:hypothetical protein